MSDHTPKSYDFTPGGLTLQLHELAAWCRSRNVSTADEAQLAAVFIERDGFRIGLDNQPKFEGELDRLRVENAALRAELAQLRASVPVLQAQVEEATRQRDACHEFCARAENDRDAARAEAEQWRREHEVMCIEAKDARARSRQDADERDAARADLARAQTRIDGLEGVATQLREVRAKLEAERDEAMHRRDELRHRLDARDAVVCEQNSHMQAVQRERDAHKARAEALERGTTLLKEHPLFAEGAIGAQLQDARADVERLTARVGVLREALAYARNHPTWRDRTDGARLVDVALASPDAASDARDERLKREEQRVFYGGLALAFGLEDEDLNSVGSSVVEKIRARIARDARAERDAEWLLVLGVAGVEPTPCMPEQMRGAFAAVRAAALEEAADLVSRTGGTMSIGAMRLILANAIRALSTQPAEPTPATLAVKLEAPNEHALLDGLWRTFVAMLGKAMGDKACPGGRGHRSETASTDRAETCPYCVCEFMRGATDLAANGDKP